VREETLLAQDFRGQILDSKTFQGLSLQTEQDTVGLQSFLLSSIAHAHDDSVAVNTRLGKSDKSFLAYKDLAFCVPPTFVRINPTGRFPCALCLQTLELYLNLIEALCHGPEFWGQVNSHDRAGGNSESSFRRHQRDEPNCSIFLTARRALVEK
jgi:hypothetical protein